MIDECIHGLDRDRCDVCSPKVVPKPEAPVRPTAKSTQATAPRAAPRRSTPSASTKSKPLLNVSTQRIHHVTHLRNLAGILDTGGLTADARPPVDISSPSNREVRRATPIVGEESASVADYVPFFLSPDASLWEGIRAGSGDPRFSAAVQELAASEFVILVSTVGAQTGDVVVTDGDAADPRSRFGSTTETWERMLRRILADQESDAVLRAEFLVRDAVPFETVSVIGVANDRVRDTVREALGSSTFSPRIAVHPPWFAVPTEE